MQSSNLQLSNLVGYDAESYRQRDNYSPEPIRDAIWNLFGSKIQGTVLDAGSGSGGWIKRLQRQSAIDKIISVDIADGGASQIEYVDFHICDLSSSSLPCEDHASVSFSFCTMAIAASPLAGKGLERSFVCRFDSLICSVVLGIVQLYA